ncbi:MAG: nucleoside 2-deoxyribosyltransferase, partial [Planctomycetes bacterium]|nr:nucleoside 2-deoxyribosyltransferase [Planctomycetota bacterium]MCH2584750.1 nucleoside 2-deoxyribosyltransferase [Planctomycetota bacterium]
RLKAKAQAKGIVAFSPLDSEVDITASDIVPTIFRINIEDIDKADVVLANVQPFRGECCDDGTAFELGVAFVRRKGTVPQAIIRIQDRPTSRKPSLLERPGRSSSA